MTEFKKFNLPEGLLEALDKLGINAPTPIQSLSIPESLQGKDILATAQTGTGKTIAYLLPLIMHLIQNPTQRALVLAPTRELAGQVKDAFHALMTKYSFYKTALLIGGDSMSKQLDILRKKPQVIIGTPGRINDHLMRRTLDLSATSFLVIDEADRMLDMGFGEQLEKIAKSLPEVRQTVMFSATLPSNILKLSEKYMANPVRLSVEGTNKPAEHIRQEIIRTSTSDKFRHLTEALEQREGSVIVFVKTKRSADQLADRLNDHDQSADAIHGDLSQRQRNQVLKSFRREECRILVATDVAARGLDIPHIRHVINYDLPQCAEDYIHRIGRTGRAGADGDALCFISPEDGAKWRAIHRLLNPGAPVEPHPHLSRRNSGGSQDRSHKPFQKSYRPHNPSPKPGFQRGESQDNTRESFRGSSERRSEGAPFRGKKEDFKKSFGPSSESGPSFQGKREGRKGSSAPRSENSESQGKKEGFKKSFVPRSGDSSFQGKREGFKGSSSRSANPYQDKGQGRGGARKAYQAKSTPR